MAKAVVVCACYSGDVCMLQWWCMHVTVVGRACYSGGMCACYSGGVCACYSGGVCMLQ